MVPQQQRRRRRRAALPRTPERRVIVARGVGGFGFTIAGQRPCVVSAVAAGGPAERAGLRAGDALLAVDGANVARASHASVARLVAAAPGAIALSVAPREAPPTDTEDTEPDERARTKRRHPPPRRRPHPLMHHPGCHAAPSTSGVNEILQNLSRAQLTPSHAARLECRAVVGYLGTIETPQAAATAAPGNVRTAVRKLRQERRPATPVLLSVLPNVLLLRRPNGQVLAQYHRERIVYAGCGSEADRRYFGLVTSAEMPEAEISHSCHVFAVDPRMAEHDAHATRAREFQIACSRDPVAERCLEFPPSAEYVVGVIKGMYSLPPDDCTSPTLQQISKLAIKGDSPAMGNFARCNRAVFRVPRDRRACRHDDARLEGQEFVANSPQPSNHSEITTTSSNSDSGIGFHNDCRNIADRILVVDFAGQQPPPNRFRQEMPRRPLGLVGCSSFDADGSFLSNTTPVVDGFGGQGRPLNLDDVILNSNDLQPVRHVSPRNDDDNYNYNVYGNLPSTSRSYNGAVYDQVYTENEGHHYEMLPPQLDMDLEIDRVAETFNSVEIYEERSRQADCHSNESVENVTVISGGTSKASMDSVSVYSSRSHEEARPPLRKHLQASLDDMLVLGLRDPQPAKKDDHNFVHPASVKYKVRKSKPLNVLSKTRHIFTGRDRDKKEERRRAMSASAGDVTGNDTQDLLSAAASEPDLRDSQSEQSSPFRRWTTGSGSGSSYRHTDHRALYNKQQMSEGASAEGNSSGGARGQWPNGGVARWSLGLEHLLADPVGAAAFGAFLEKEFARENLTFYLSVEAYNQCRDAAERTVLANEIWERHLADNAPEPVNIDAAARRHTLNRMSQAPPPADLFQAPKEDSEAHGSRGHHSLPKPAPARKSERPLHSSQPSLASDLQSFEHLRQFPHPKLTFPEREFPDPWVPLESQDVQAQRHVFNVMKFDSYPRFLRSSIHAECARADLRGLPPPYGPGSSESGRAVSPMTIDEETNAASTSKPEPEPEWERATVAAVPRRPPSPCELELQPLAPRAAAADPQRATTDNLKKSASNASERRRSGGGSLLGGWRLRGPSRERPAAPVAPAAPLPPAPAVYNGHSNAPHHTNAPSSTAVDTHFLQTDVVKSGAHCRVVLPDGATSVVVVEPPVAVRALVDRLLQRRNLHVPNYDVLRRDPPHLNTQTGETSVTAIDANAPSTLLGGSEVVVERRCVVRMEVSGKCVAVRCRPGRRLGHVLRPVLARYAASQAPRAVLRDGAAVSPDTHMQDLDGARLQVVELGESEECGRVRERDDDSDSLSELAVRADDPRDDEAAFGRGLRDAGAASGRVRAALRPGPPLHHHPPDFLENLRETQRQRLHHKLDPSAAPRTPPALPPKPASRAPTLV